MKGETVSLNIGELLHDAVPAQERAGVANLVTRRVGRAVRELIEERMQGLADTLIVVDLSGISMIDFACADEIIAKLLLQYSNPDSERRTYFAFQGVLGGHKEAIEAVLRRHDLAIAAHGADGSVHLVGAASKEAREMWEESVRRADLLEKPLLDGLHKPTNETRRIVAPNDFRIDSSIVVTNPEVLRFLDAHPETIYSLSPRQFEELIAALLERFGYTVALGPLGADGGVDVFAERRSATGTELLLVQCKRYRPGKTVPMPIVKQLWAEVAGRGASRGIVATTSWFTRAALSYIEERRYQLSGVDHKRLRDWLRCSVAATLANKTASPLPR